MPGPYPRYSNVCPEARRTEGLLNSTAIGLILRINELESWFSGRVPRTPRITLILVLLLLLVILKISLSIWIYVPSGNLCDVEIPTGVLIDSVVVLDAIELFKRRVSPE